MMQSDWMLNYTFESFNCVKSNVAIANYAIITVFVTLLHS